MASEKPTRPQRIILERMRGGAALRQWERGKEHVAATLNGLPGQIPETTVTALRVARWIKRTASQSVARGQYMRVYEITEAGRRAIARHDGGF